MGCKNHTWLVLKETACVFNAAEIFIMWARADTHVFSLTHKTTKKRIIQIFSLLRVDSLKSLFKALLLIAGNRTIYDLWAPTHLSWGSSTWVGECTNTSMLRERLIIIYWWFKNLVEVVIIYEVYRSIWFDFIYYWFNLSILVIEYSLIFDYYGFDYWFT